MERTTFRCVGAAVFAAALLVAGCGDDTEEPSGTTDTTATTDEGVGRSDGEPIETSTTDVGDEEPEPVEDGTIIDVVVTGGTVEGGGRTSVPLGDSVTIRVTSDVADHIHLHGYDVMVDVAAGEPAELTFDATIPGIFEVELEDSRIQLLELEIS